MMRSDFLATICAGAAVLAMDKAGESASDVPLMRPAPIPLADTAPRLTHDPGTTGHTRLQKHRGRGRHVARAPDPPPRSAVRRPGVSGCPRLTQTT
eukprot:1150885-Rhodomonas_salina.2